MSVHQDAIDLCAELAGVPLPLRAERQLDKLRESLGLVAEETPAPGLVAHPAEPGATGAHLSEATRAAVLAEKSDRRGAMADTSRRFGIPRQRVRKIWRRG